MKKTAVENNPLYNDQIVEMLSKAIYRGSSAMRYVPDLVKDVIEHERWKYRIVRRTGEPQSFTSFEEFVKAEPLEGLGTNLFILRSLCTNVPEVIRMIDTLVEQSNHPSIDSSPLLLEKLANSHPTLAEKLIRGELTLREAATKAGFQERRARLFPVDVKDTAEKIIKAFDAEWGSDSSVALDELIKMLMRYQRK